MKWLALLLFVQGLHAQCLEIPVTVTDVAVPSQVNKSTEAVVMLNGMFPNSCYRLERTDVRHPDGFTHEITAYAEVADEICLMTGTLRIYEFLMEVPLGPLQPGEHNVIVYSGNGKVFENKMIVQ